MQTIISTSNAPGAIGPYSQAVKARGLLFLSGQLGIDPVTGAMADGVQAQTRQALTNARQILTAAGSSMASVVKTTVFLADISDFSAMNEIYATFFPAGSCPTRSAFQVAALPKGALVEIELIAEA